MELLTSISPMVGMVGLMVAFAISFTLKRQPAGNEPMQGIAEQIHIGAMAFLKREQCCACVFRDRRRVVVGIVLASANGSRVH